MRDRPLYDPFTLFHATLEVTRSARRKSQGDLGLKAQGWRGTSLPWVKRTHHDHKTPTGFRSLWLTAAKVFWHNPRGRGQSRILTTRFTWFSLQQCLATTPASLRNNGCWVPKIPNQLWSKDAGTDRSPLRQQTTMTWELKFGLRASGYAASCVRNHGAKS